MAVIHIAGFLAFGALLTAFFAYYDVVVHYMSLIGLWLLGITMGIWLASWVGISLYRAIFRSTGRA